MCPKWHLCIPLQQHIFCKQAPISSKSCRRSVLVFYVKRGGVKSTIGHLWQWCLYMDVKLACCQHVPSIQGTATASCSLCCNENWRGFSSNFRIPKRFHHTLPTAKGLTTTCPWCLECRNILNIPKYNFLFGRSRFYLSELPLTHCH